MSESERGEEAKFNMPKESNESKMLDVKVLLTTAIWPASPASNTAIVVSEMECPWTVSFSGTLFCNLSRTCDCF